MRPLHLPVLLLALTAAPRAVACTCGGSAGVLSSSTEGYHEVGAPVVVADGQGIADVLLLEEGAPIAFEERIVRNDSLCAPALRALSPLRSAVPGSSWVLTTNSGDVRWNASYWNEGAAEVYLNFVEPRPRQMTSLEVRVTWVLAPEPSAFQGGLCAANVLIPLQDFGGVEVVVASSRPVEFYATLEVQLSNGEPYSVSRRASHFSSHAAERSVATDWAPITTPEPPCVDIGILDESLREMWTTTACAPARGAPAERISALFEASLPLVERWPLPAEAPEPARSEACGYAGVSPPLSPWWPLAALVFLARRQRGSWPLSPPRHTARPLRARSRT